ncbi:MAG TPA: sigma-70 family RNA polymerase sigma factor [Haliangiales bacterium]|nr:sigma-70 family RNA polymerase sigma factor [Haliangiales bacterium]
MLSFLQTNLGTGPGPGPGDEETLLRRVARADAAALRALYDRYAGRVMAVAVRMLGSTGEAEEVVQDTFVDIWNRARSYDRARGAPGAWVVTIGRNRAIDRLRARATAARTASGLRREAETAPAPARSPLDAALQNDAQARVGTALGSLPPEQRRVVELAFFDGLSQSEIAARTGDPLGTVKGRARAALEKLARLLGEGGQS